MKQRTVTCPSCKGPSPFEAGNPWRPFCSQRCREHDLGAWASESYRVQAPASTEDADPDELGGTSTVAVTKHH
jgi:endogenous inhibitor of DNA gyrase (YacG/DUF329 family)